MDPEFTFSRATIQDEEALVALINSAYRGEASRAGWTTEASLITGARIDATALRPLILEEGSKVLMCLQGGEIIGSVHLKRLDDATAYLGMFVVKPRLQGAGIGKRFLAEAEACVQACWGCTRMTLSVITVRAELIAFYERRGYSDTGEKHPFPTEAGASVPLVSGLVLGTYSKRLAVSL